MVIDANLVKAHSARMAKPPEALLSAHILSEMRAEKIGARLKLIREALGFTPAQIADDLGIERTYWSRFENGKRPPNEITMALLVERYGLTTDFILLGKWDRLPLDLASRMRGHASSNN